MFSFFHKRKLKKETSIIFVIESGKIISSIIHFDGERAPEYLYSHKNNITFQQDVDEKRLEDLMLTSLKQSAEKLCKEGLTLFKHNTSSKINTYIFLGSPWYTPEYTKSEIVKDKDFIISSDLVKKMSEEKLKEKGDNVIIEHKIISMKANGYDLIILNNQKANEFTVNSIISSSPKKLISDIEGMINLSIIHTNFIYHTTIQAIFPIAKELIKKEDFVMFIPEHEASDLVVVRHGNIEKMISIHYGKHSPVRALSQNVGDENMGNHSLIMMYLGGKLEKGEEDRVKALLDASKSKFLDTLRDALWKLSSTIFLPQDIVISDGHPISKLLGQWIQTEEFTSKTMTIKNFNVFFMENKDIIDRIITKDKVGYLNPFLISVGIYLKSL